MPENKKIKVGVFGVGALGRHHARLYAQNPKAEVVGIFDVRKDQAAAVGKEFSLPVFEDWKTLAEKCDALSVAVPADYHASSTLPLLEMGKHVLVEKPIASSVDDAVKMVECAKKHNAVLAVGHVERFNPAMDYLTSQHVVPCFINARRLAGYPPARAGMLRRGTEVSVILDLMIHDLDLVLALIGSEVERIDVAGTAVLSDSEDIVNARIKFQNGAVAELTASRVSPEPSRIVTAYQDGKSFAMDFGKHCGTVVKPLNGELQKEDVMLPEKNALAEELDDFLNAVSGKVSAPRVPGDQALKALKLAVAIENECRTYQKKYQF